MIRTVGFLAAALVICMSDAVILAQNAIVSDDTAKASVIQSIRTRHFDDEVVQIQGVVQYWRSLDNKTTIQYCIKDRWGEFINVRSSNARPEVNFSYVISGIVTWDAKEGVPFLDERSRTVMTDRDAEKAYRQLAEAQGAAAEIGGKWWLNSSEAVKAYAQAKESYLAKDYPKTIEASLQAAALSRNAPYSVQLYAMVIILLVLVAGGVIVIRKKNAERHYQAKTTPIGMPSSSLGMPVQAETRSNETVITLNGRLLQLSGDTKPKEIRFFVTKHNQDEEFTIGRNPGKQFAHIQIDHPTVSSDQARIFHVNGTYSLVNRSNTNPTKVNGNPLAMNENITIKDGDKISFGALDYVYYQQ